MTPQEQLIKINEALTKGFIVTFTNYLHQWQITQKTVEKFEKAGSPLLKAKDDGIYMAHGKHYNCMNGCAIHFWK